MVVLLPLNTIGDVDPYLKAFKITCTNQQNSETNQHLEHFALFWIIELLNNLFRFI